MPRTKCPFPGYISSKPTHLTSPLGKHAKERKVQEEREDKMKDKMDAKRRERMMEYVAPEEDGDKKQKKEKKRKREEGEGKEKKKKKRSSEGEANGDA